MPGEPSPPLDEAVAAVRRFSRFYTRRIGVLQEGLLGGPLSLPEGRLVWELAQGEEQTAARLAATLALDPGYVSRLLRTLEERGFIARSASPRDARETLIALAPEGRAAYAEINARVQQEVGAMLAGLVPDARSRLVAALAYIERLLGDGPEPRVPYILRPPRIGDLGLVVARQAALYASEYGWNGEFEALLAEIAAAFIRNFDPARERCWIAERGGEMVGSVFVVRADDELAKLRMLYVEPAARGLGIGARLVEECLAFARAAGYRRMTLWTNDILTAARHIYERAGFRLVQAERHHSFGHDLVGENWERDL
ncbi:MAG: GNAT family N-acetyltransferase [Rhodospirillales bacterium]|nr:GNAT family N-acetyltransferase [Rhodospirillales bacterium]